MEMVNLSDYIIINCSYKVQAVDACTMYINPDQKEERRRREKEKGSSPPKKQRRPIKVILTESEETTFDARA
ncbi:MAG: hypothetical protein IJP31_12565 [Lachnospiraceae bacterium]|nr:hypothetical protein [Lachnospiraceae bacterium]